LRDAVIEARLKLSDFIVKRLTVVIDGRIGIGQRTMEIDSRHFLGRNGEYIQVQEKLDQEQKEQLIKWTHDMNDF